MNIIIDLDNTLFYNDVVDVACSDAGIERTTQHDLSDLPQEVQDVCWSEFKNVDRMCSLEPFDSAIGIDKILTDKGHRVFVVSARSMNLYKGSVEMVQKHFPLITDVVLADSYEKASIYSKLKADVVIDDHSVHINQAIDVGVPTVIMVSHEGTRYNHEFIDAVKARGALIANDVSILKEI